MKDAELRMEGVCLQVKNDVFWDTVYFIRENVFFLLHIIYSFEL
jgi:hypothetical protein